MGPDDYINPLRPGGRVLSPYSDTLAPVVGRPAIARDGRVVVSAYDPQSFRMRTTTYETPVLAPIALAYRVFSRGGRRVTPLEWSLRGSHHLPNSLTPLVFAPRAHSAGWSCFATRLRCVPDWTYRLAGGLAPSLSSLGLRPGRYRLTVYAWDAVGNVTALDSWFARSAAGFTSSRAP
jgi:hypothetical protein